MSELCAELVEHMGPYLDQPYALFGHSCGAVIAFQLAHSLQCAGFSPPVHVFASASPTPHSLFRQPHLAHYSLSDQQLVAYLNQVCVCVSAHLCCCAGVVVALAVLYQFCCCCTVVVVWYQCCWLGAVAGCTSVAGLLPYLVVPVLLGWYQCCASGQIHM
jgi:Thioesterase domain